MYSSSGLLHSLVRFLYYTTDPLGMPSLATDGGRVEVWSGGFEPAATMPDFDYSYEVYREALERYNNGRFVQEHPRDALPLLNLEEFVGILEFREQELLRLINTWNNDQGDSGTTWERFKEANSWE